MDTGPSCLEPGIRRASEMLSRSLCTRRQGSHATNHGLDSSTSTSTVARTWACLIGLFSMGRAYCRMAFASLMGSPEISLANAGCRGGSNDLDQPWPHNSKKSTFLVLYLGKG